MQKQIETGPYLDAVGHPVLRMSIVAFIDILGFSHASTSNATSAAAQQVLDRIVAAIDDARSYVRESFPGDELAKTGRWEVKFFSDNLALGYPVDERIADAATTAWFLIRCAQRYQLRMALNGYFLRGAMTQGDVCLTDQIIFGSALVECYQHESKVSIVPRVILTEPLQQLLLSAVSADAKESICRDVDGWWFVNYLDAAREGSEINWESIERHKISILKSLSSTTRHEVLPKFGWACRYHNIFCHWHRDAPGYADRYRVERVDEQSTISRLSETIDSAS
jgi:hypothetical protein